MDVARAVIPRSLIVIMQDMDMDMGLLIGLPIRVKFESVSHEDVYEVVTIVDVEYRYKYCGFDKDKYKQSRLVLRTDLARNLSAEQEESFQLTSVSNTAPTKDEVDRFLVGRSVNVDAMKQMKKEIWRICRPLITRPEKVVDE